MTGNEEITTGDLHGNIYGILYRDQAQIQELNVSKHDFYCVESAWDQCAR